MIQTTPTIIRILGIHLPTTILTTLQIIPIHTTILTTIHTHTRTRWIEEARSSPS